ncbi:MAG: YcxB family protein, partial [Candidatus Heimdallarchaeota archaeon]
MDEVKSELVITFRYRYEDHRKAFLRNYFAQKLIIALLIAVPILLIFAFVFWLVAKSFIGFTNFEYGLFFFLLTMFLILLLIPFLALIQLKHQVRTTYQYGQIDNTAVLNFQGLHWKTPNGEINYQWLHMYKVIEQKEAFCFFFNSRQFIIV